LAKPSTQIWWLILFGIACYGFGVLSVTADELYGIAQYYGSSGLYFFPIIGPRDLWNAWVLVFGGLAVCFFVAVVSVMMFQKSRDSRTIEQRRRAELGYN
jgi:phosphotransferase system  glucose/maltose/N-acetylglucosamine-specific IIC component